MSRITAYAFFCLAFVALSLALSKIPAEWQRQIDKYDAFYSENDDGDFNSEGYPGIYLPLIGNGYFSHSKGVRSDTYFIAGVYNNETTNPSIRARIPATFAVQVNNSETTGALLDIRNGTYYRRGLLSLYPGAWYELRWYAHMHRRNIYVMELQVFTSGHQRVELKLINNAGSPTDAIDFHQKDSEDFIVQCGNTTIPETPQVPTTRVCMVSTKVTNNVVFYNKDSGKTRTFITAVRTSLDSTDPDTHSMDDFSSAVSSQTDFKASTTVPTPLQAEHIEAWSELWKAGYEFTGTRPDIAIAANASLYAVLSSVRDDWPYGLAPGGLTNYYSGHSFWDTETWMYPSLLLMRPSTAQSLIAYRFNRLDGAYEKAKSYSPPYAGAMFPWESAFTGSETCPLWASTGLREQHISADISLAVWQYWSVTGDKVWLRDIAYPILRGVADFLVSRSVVETAEDGTQVAHIYDVIPPDEYVDHGNDSVYTNYGAACALRYAVSAANILNLQTPLEYTTIADSLEILFDSTTNIHPEYAGYSGDIIKQADVVLLHYPWNLEMSDEVRRSDLDYYSQRSDPNGPAMTWGMHMIGYKDLQMLAEAAQFFNRSFQDNTHEPFNVWSETPSGGAGNFITGAGGFLQTITHGYPGLRVADSALEINYPVCPEGVNQLRLRNVGYLGSRISISFSCNSYDAISCPSMATNLQVELKSAGEVKLVVEALDPESGDVSTTYALSEGLVTSIDVSCPKTGVPKFLIMSTYGGV